MRLTKEEYYQFLEIHPKLIYYVGKKKKLLPPNVSFDEFMDYSVKDKYQVRDELYNNIGLLDDYIRENAKNLSEEEKEIISGFKYYKRGIFYVIKLTKKFAFFLGDKYVYGVYALGDPFQMFWGNNLPVIIETVLLPYKGKIIYDGMVVNHSIRFGKGMKSSIKNNYALSEGKYGIITELPEKTSVDKFENSFENELLIMMKTKSSREYNWYEIEDLLENHPELEPVYIREWGRINSRKKKKELRGLGINRRWFAIHNDTILLSGKSKKELEGQIKELIPEKENRDGVYYFKM